MPENEAKGWLGWLHPLSSSLPALADPVFFFADVIRRRSSSCYLFSLSLLSFLHPPPSHLYLGLADPPKKLAS